MKKILFVLFSSFLLVACSVDDSPDAIFDDTLSQVEAFDEMQTTLTLKNQQEHVLTVIETKSLHLQQDPIVLMTIDDQSLTTKADDVLARFCRFDFLTDRFKNVTITETEEGKRITFETDGEDEKALFEALSDWISSPFQKVEREMRLDKDDQLTEVIYRIRTNETYVIQLEMEEAK